MVSEKDGSHFAVRAPLLMTGKTKLAGEPSFDYLLPLLITVASDPGK